jgi:hypothetical protein
MEEWRESDRIQDGDSSYLKPDLEEFDGLKVPGSLLSLSLPRFREAVNYVPDERDIVVSTYPKSGTTWMLHIVWSILNGGQEPPSFVELNTKYVTMPVLEGTKVLESKSLPR